MVTDSNIDEAPEPFFRTIEIDGAATIVDDLSPS